METFIKNLAKSTGRILKDGFGKKLKISSKSAHFDLVTQYDLLADRHVINTIRNKYPNHGIMTEESGHIIKKPDFWIVDPLDGTTGFVNNVPSFCVSIAFVSRNKIKLAAIFAPISGELFFAQAGKRAFLNNSKISVSDRSEMKFAGGYTWMATNTTSKAEKMAMYKNIIENELRPMSSHSAALSLCFVACGRFDFVSTKGLFPWDWAAGSLIMKEAGAKVTDFQNRPYRWDSTSVLAANPVLHRKIIQNFKFGK